MPLILQHRIYRRDLQSNPSIMYVFGDNQARYGLGGQAAEMRGEPNAHGIATLYEPGVPWRDSTYSKNIICLFNDFEPVVRRLEASGIVIWPTDGIGTGFAQLEACAPQTWDYLQTRVAALTLNFTPPSPTV